ncbi:hypothetical protein DPMN_025234 [Dreissena polymorpha]|uniref:Uncharacterized protein n=1 Tax=Dreissena polymorpha TaxID=45954 RepID=A0A9D4LPG7_DREPO|nr:hypothetical protein DPMN_025234 [Dreissena polymorpha]
MKQPSESNQQSGNRPILHTLISSSSLSSNLSQFFVRDSFSALALILLLLHL